MEEARQRQAVVGGTDEATEALCTLYLYCFTLFLWQYFSLPLFFSFFLQLHTSTYTPTVSAAPASAEHSHKRRGHTVPCSQLSLYSLQKKHVQS